jgi:N-acetylglutamate synthase-like GNAT family acetyltransferase
LKEICALDALQRKGIGKSLIGKLEEILKENGVSRIYLFTQRDSVPSDFYSALGFTENQNIMVMGKQVEKSS